MGGGGGGGGGGEKGGKLICRKKIKKYISRIIVDFAGN